MWREALDALASVVFPAPCRVCGEALTTASRIPVCPSCLAGFARIVQPMCGQCGRPFISALAATAAEPLCRLCRAGTYEFTKARSFARYDEAMGKAMTLIKYERITPLADWFAARLAELAAREGGAFAADAVVPVPLHPDRLRERGYNQAELLARPLAKRLGLPLGSYLLVRVKPRPPRLKLTRRERWETTRGAYATREGAEVDKLRILLIDDVFTTGATLDSCSRALRKAGAAEVYGLTAARVTSAAFL